MAHPNAFTVIFFFAPKLKETTISSPFLFMGTVYTVAAAVSAPLFRLMPCALSETISKYPGACQWQSIHPRRHRRRYFPQRASCRSFIHSRITIKAISLLAFALGVCRAQPVISTVAGNGTLAFSGDGGAATLAALGTPTSCAVDASNNLYIVDRNNNRIRKVTPDGTISTFAGNGKLAFSGDGGPAVNAALFEPVDVAVDKAGNVYIADQGNDAIRKVNASGIISTVAGGPQAGNSPPPGGAFTGGDSVAVDAAGNIYSSGAANITRIDSSGKLTIIAGASPGFAGDGGPAKSAMLDQPSGIAFDSSGNLYFADKLNRRVRKIDTNGIITTVAGSNSLAFSGDGGPATNAGFGRTAAAFMGVAVDSKGNIYIADPADSRVRLVNSSGIISTFAGNGTAGTGNQGDGNAADKASLLAPNGVALDSSGNLYIADTSHNKIRKVSVGSDAGSTVPAISANGVVNAASLTSGIAANSWITILGVNLAPKTDDWSKSVVGGKLPTSLDGVSVTIGGLPAYIYYISPNQINALAPDISAGSAPVIVTTTNGTSAPMNVTVSAFNPAFFLWPGNQAVATRPDYTFAVNPGTFTVTTTAAKPGEVIILWGTGFGPTAPPSTPGIVTPSEQVYSTASPPTVMLGTTPAQVLGAALAPGSAGLYQIAVQLPMVANGTYSIQATVGGIQSPPSAMLAICSTSSCSDAKRDFPDTLPKNESRRE